jgi:hypothetical protein
MQEQIVAKTFAKNMKKKTFVPTLVMKDKSLNCQYSTSVDLIFSFDLREERTKSFLYFGEKMET